MYRILKVRFFLLLLLPVHLWAQEATVIDHKGTKIRVTSNSVTTSPTATATPVVGDIWFNTSSNTAEVYDGSQWKLIEQRVVPLWQSNSNGGVYAIFDVVSRNGVLYKNRTGTNTDSSPNTDATNWTRVDQDLGSIVSIGNGILIRPNWPSIGLNLRVDDDGVDTFYTSYPSYRITEDLGGTNGGNLLIKGTATGTAGEPRLSVPEVVHAAFSPDSNFRLNGILNTDTFSTDWQSNTDGGTYLTNAIVAYNGVFYRNLTGSNSDTNPNSDVTNWTTSGANDVLVKVGLNGNRSDFTNISNDASHVRWDDLYNTKIIDTHNAFDLANTTFTAPMDGWYEVFSSFRFNTALANGILYWAKNGVNGGQTDPTRAVFSGLDAANEAGRGKVIVGIIYLDAGETLELKNRFGSARSITIAGGSNTVIKRIR